MAKVSDFSHKNFKCLKYLTKNIAIIKDDDGTFYAIEADCKHQNANLLSRGMKTHIVTCPRHGWRYNMKTGECLTHKWARLKKYPLKIENDQIYVGTKPLAIEEVTEDFEMG